MSLLNTANKIIKAKQAQPGQLPANLTEDEFYDMIEFDPRPFQDELLRSKTRFNVNVVHRRGGKSVAEVVKLLRSAIACPFDHGRYAYTGPTQDQVRDIAWHYLLEFGNRIPGFVPKESKREVWLPQIRGSVSRIKLYGVDNPKQRLRGLYLDGATPDEIQDQPPHVWVEQMRPMLADENRRGTDVFGYPNQWADFIGTPKGRNLFYRIFRDASIWMEGRPVMQKDPKTGIEEPIFRNDWSARMFKASETGIISRQELRDALADMGRSKYEQEFECSWDAVVEGAVFGPELEELRRLKRITSIPINPHLPVHTAWDLGWDDYTAIWFFQQVGKEYFFVDYMETRHQSIPELARALGDKRYRYGRHMLPHDVEVSELTTGKSRRAVLNESGVRVSVVPRVKIKADSISAGQAALPYCYFDESRCAEGLDALALYRREMDDRLGRLREAPVHDWASHAADAFQTFAVGRKRDASGGNFNSPFAET